MPDPAGLGQGAPGVPLNVLAGLSLKRGPGSFDLGFLLWFSLGVDNRLQRYGGSRLHLQNEADLPNLASALASLVTGRAKVVAIGPANTPYVRISGLGVEALVLKEDWIKLLPLIESGFFSTPVRPRGTPFDATNHTLYERVLANIQIVFEDTT